MCEMHNEQIKCKNKTWGKLLRCGLLLWICAALLLGEILGGMTGSRE